MLILLVLGVVLILASMVFYPNLEPVENAPFLAGVACFIVAGVVKLFFRKRKAGEKNIIEGVARNVSQKIFFEKIGQVGGRNIVVLRFRVEITDKEGNIVKVVPVEMRGKEKKIHGEIADGDSVRVKGKIKHGIVIAREVVNKTTNSIVRKK